jgi:cytochrome c peroxidase
MWNRTFRILYIILLLLINACGSGTKRDAIQDDPFLPTARAVFMYQSGSVFHQAYAEYGVAEELGKMLYYDPRLSRSGFISCNSCHNLATFGADRLPLSPGHQWRAGRRNSPTTLNAFLHVAQFWDGREETVESQALQPMIHPDEMAMKEEADILSVILSIPGYAEMFMQAFQDENPVSIENMGRAIGAFERTLVTPAPIHDYLAGDKSALNEDQYKGLQEFISVGCATCHIGETLGGKTFAQFLPPPDSAGDVGEDKGRYEFTGDPADEYFFKVPSLLNVVHTYPYFHDGSVWELEEAIRIIALSQLDLELRKDQVQSIAVFLQALTGEVPEWAREVPVLPEASTPIRPDLN